MTSRRGFDLKVDGLDESIKGLRATDRVVGQTLTAGLRRFTRELTTRAEREGRSAGGVHRHAVNEGAFRRLSDGIEIVGDTGPGAEFGALRWAQFPKWKGNEFPQKIERLRIGYMLHPALRDHIEPAEKDLADDVEESIAKEIEAQ